MIRDTKTINALVFIEDIEPAPLCWDDLGSESFHEAADITPDHDNDNKEDELPIVQPQRNQLTGMVSVISVAT